MFLCEAQFAIRAEFHKMDEDIEARQIGAGIAGGNRGRQMGYKALKIALMCVALFEKFNFLWNLNCGDLLGTTNDSIFLSLVSKSIRKYKKLLTNETYFHKLIFIFNCRETTTNNKK